MNRIERTFRELKKKGRKAFIAYITAGDPTLEDTEALVREFAGRGVDIVELGVPFSDPIADGPVNQEAAQRALVNDVSVGDILEMVKTLRKDCDLPIVFFAYFNTILAFGIEEFARKAHECGVDGVLVLDLPPEEAKYYKSLMDARDIATIFLVSPVTPDDRLPLIVSQATGFVYYVSQMGVTGMRDRMDERIPAMVERIRRLTNTPVAVGFGVSTPDHVREIARYADGVIVGSSIVRRIAERAGTPGLVREVGEFAGSLTAPLSAG